MDLLEELIAQAPHTESLVRALLGCQWGTLIALPDTDEPCSAMAERMIAIHDGDDVMWFKLCPEHADTVQANTDPHQEEEEPS